MAFAAMTVVGGLAASTPAYAVGPTASVKDGTNVEYVGTGFADRITVSPDLPGTVLLENSVTGITAGPGCKEVSSIGVRCEATTSGAVVDLVKLDLKAGFDTAEVRTSVRTTILGGDDGDTYKGATSSKGTTVVFDGGGGVDTADYSKSSAGVLVDLDGAADDGRLGRDQDNVTTSVENLTGSDHADSLRGNAVANRVFGGLGADALRGGAGDDQLVASETNLSGTEADTADLSCGKGFDSIVLDVVDPGSAECETVTRVR
jgi:Ca2+-binding RTX toxin-like protein